MPSNLPRGAEDAGPFTEGQVGGDDDRSAFVELADQMEQQLSDAESKAAEAEAKLDKLSEQLQVVTSANTSLSSKFADAQKAITSRIDDVGLLARERHKTLMILLLISSAASLVLVANLFKLLPF